MQVTQQMNLLDPVVWLAYFFVKKNDDLLIDESHLLYDKVGSKIF